METTTPVVTVMDLAEGEDTPIEMVMVGKPVIVDLREIPEEIRKYPGLTPDNKVINCKGCKRVLLGPSEIPEYNRLGAYRKKLMPAVPFIITVTGICYCWKCSIRRFGDSISLLPQKDRHDFVDFLPGETNGQAKK